MGKNKIVLGNGEVLIDLTLDTIRPDKVLVGYSGHGPDGEPFEGTCTFDVDSRDADAAADDIVDGKSAYSKGKKVDGKLPVKGAVVSYIKSKYDKIIIPYGVHDGSGYVMISAEELAKIIPTNIREGITILGELGTMSGSEDLKAQHKTVTPSFNDQEILPDSGYTAIASITVKAIPYSESPNSSGGTTVTIG